jgi:hypothetical protein
MIMSFPAKDACPFELLDRSVVKIKHLLQQFGIMWPSKGGGKSTGNGDSDIFRGDESVLKMLVVGCSTAPSIRFNILAIPPLLAKQKPHKPISETYHPATLLDHRGLGSKEDARSFPSMCTQPRSDRN